MQILKDVTLFFSRSTLNLATVIPVMDIINEKLTTDSLDCSKFKAPIRAALGLAKKTLNRYYNMTDSSEVYWIAMGMYFLYLLLNTLLIYVITQSCTLDTSSHTSRMQVGRMSGSTPPNGLSMMNMSACTNNWWMVKRLETRTQSDLYVIVLSTQY